MNHTHRLIFILAVALGLHSAASAGVKVGDIDAVVQPVPSLVHRSGMPGEGTCHGYVELRVQLRNNSAEDRVVHLSFPPRSGALNYGALITRTVNVPARQAVAVSLYQPPQNVANEALEVKVEGVKDPGVISVGSPYSNRYSYNESPRIAVLLGRRVPQEFCEGMREERKSAAKTKPSHVPAEVTEAIEKGLMSGALPAGGEGPAAERFTFLRSELPAAQWSHNWLGYSCYDAIVLGGREVEEMPPQARLALRRWVECGGTLLVNAQTVPDVFTEGGHKGAKDDIRVGLGGVIVSRDDGNQGWRRTYRRLVDAGIPIYCPTDAPDTHDGLMVARDHGSRPRAFRVGVAVRRGHRPGQSVAALALQAADLAVVERARHLAC